MKKSISLQVLALIITVSPACSFAHEEACTKDHDCHDGEFCEFPVGECGKSSAKGTCIALPEVCTMNFQPVCGCDSKTYPNACAAQKDKVSVLTNEECK